MGERDRESRGSNRNSAAGDGEMDQKQRGRDIKDGREI